MIFKPHSVAGADHGCLATAVAFLSTLRATCVKPRLIPRRWGVKHYYQPGKG